MAALSRERRIGVGSADGLSDSPPVGLGITIASVAAAGGGERYFVTTGLIIYGIFRLGRGLMRLSK